MRFVLCVLVTMLPVVAAAERFEAAARIGASTMSRSYECDGSDWSYRATGFFVDAEGGVRVARHLSVAAFAGYSRLGDEGHCHDLGDYRWSTRDHVLDGGVRIQVDTHGLFFGIGLGLEETLESGGASWVPATGYASAAPAKTYDIHEWRDGKLAEAHGGFTFPRSPRCGGCAVQIFGVMTRAGDDDTLRLALGVQF